MAAETRFPWWPVAATVAILAMVAAALLRLPAPPRHGPAGPRSPAENVTLLDPTAASAVLHDRLLAYDQTSLFLPTALSSGQTELPTSLQPEAGVLADAVPAKVELLGFSAERFGIKSADPTPAPRNATEGLKLTERPDAPLALGRADGNLNKLPARLGVVEAVATGTGKVVLSAALVATVGAPAGDWQPLELLGSVSAAGLVGDLVVVTSSGSEEVDKYFRDHLAQVFRAGERLPPGVYAFRVGP